MVKEDVPPYVIKKLVFFHCKRGPKRCYLCQEQKTEKICLLKICPSDGIACRMIQVKIGNKNLLCEIEIIQVFSDMTEATLFVQKENVVLDLGKD